TDLPFEETFYDIVERGNSPFGVLLGQQKSFREDRYMKAYTRWLSAALFGAAVFVAANINPAFGHTNSDAADGPIGQTRQAIISGELVGIQTEKDMGLVTVGGRCSGTLVNRSWVLTATHCITTDVTASGPTAALANDVIKATCTSRTAIPTRVVRN